MTYGATANGTPPADIGFNGHVHDADTALVYMQQRYYDPIAGRFLSVDPVTTGAKTGGNFNRYTYANNSPYKYKDRDGRFADTVFDIASLGFSIYQFVQEPSWSNAGGVAIDAAATLIPFVPGGVGIARQAASIADKSADIAKGSAGLRNGHLAGSAHPNTGIPFDKAGFPDFSGVATAEVKIAQTGSRAGDVRAANEAAGFKSTPSQTTWHHHQDGETMQLVPRDVHAQTGHTGGFQGVFRVEGRIESAKLAKELDAE
jgi:RHS repeat-associated protein